jgi:hypothetical protein
LRSEAIITENAKVREETFSTKKKSYKKKITNTKSESVEINVRKLNQLTIASHQFEDMRKQPIEN